MNNHFFHFTKYKNLESIKKYGLVPKIGFHAQALEISKKVFFVEGLDNLLILFDCWIHVCEKYPHIPGLFNLGAKVKGKNKISRSIINVYFFWTKINIFHRFVAYKYFDGFLKNYVLLHLDIKEEIDFSFDDVDQIKAKEYDKEYLIKAGYSLKYSDLESTNMDKWNLHTFSNHGIDSSKLKICYVEDSYKMSNILNYALQNISLDIEDVCPVLFDYLKSRKII